MTPPEDHAAFLARTDFPVPAGADLTAAERDVLVKFGRWMEALEGGVIKPVTPAQEQFLKVAREELAPSTQFETVWAKFVRMRAGVVGCFQGFARARAEKAAIEAEYSARRNAILAAVRDQLDAVDAEFAERLQAANDAVAAGEAAVREVVLRVGKGVQLAGIDVRYHPGRVTWDPAGMDQFAALHPEVMALRKVGNPWVSVRYTDAGPPKPAVRQLPAAEPDEPADGAFGQ